MHSVNGTPVDCVKLGMHAVVDRSLDAAYRFTFRHVYIQACAMRQAMFYHARGYCLYDVSAGCYVAFLAIFA